MKFGKTEHPEWIQFDLPQDHADTAAQLRRGLGAPPQVYVGCAKWNKRELLNFYPRGIKDELRYYATQFNSIEMNTTFYRMPEAGQVVTWAGKTPTDFRFYPKITQRISHLKRLKEVEELVAEYCHSIQCFGDRLGMVFLQMHSNFGFKNFERLQDFVSGFPTAIPLAVELRHPDWYHTAGNADALGELLREFHVTHVITDTAGRRDMLHMRLTTPVAFIRFVGANDPLTDRLRLEQWVERLKGWVDRGLQQICFFVHQNEELESPALAAFLIEKLNATFGWELKVPALMDNL
ncbi:MAG: DUF72 domain-containing protein [Marinilabiliales bacterium]|nr:DUF72 domain-containing protein [Marinilabiliales bacterium]